MSLSTGVFSGVFSSFGKYLQTSQRRSSDRETRLSPPLTRIAAGLASAAASSVLLLKPSSFRRSMKRATAIGRCHQFRRSTHGPSSCWSSLWSALDVAWHRRAGSLGAAPLHCLRQARRRPPRTRPSSTRSPSMTTMTHQSGRLHFRMTIVLMWLPSFDSLRWWRQPCRAWDCHWRRRPGNCKVWWRCVDRNAHRMLRDTMHSAASSAVDLQMDRRPVEKPPTMPRRPSKLTYQSAGGQRPMLMATERWTRANWEAGRSSDWRRRAERSSCSESWRRTLKHAMMLHDTLSAAATERSVATAINHYI